MGQGTLGRSIPVCIIYGENDNTGNQTTSSPITTFSVEKLYEFIPGDSKMMFKVACGGHSMLWKKNAQNVLHNYSKQWLKNGRTGQKGSFYRDKHGNISEVIPPVERIVET